MISLQNLLNRIFLTLITIAQIANAWTITRIRPFDWSFPNGSAACTFSASATAACTATATARLMSGAQYWPAMNFKIDNVRNGDPGTTTFYPTGGFWSDPVDNTTAWYFYFRNIAWDSYLDFYLTDASDTKLLQRLFDFTIHIDSLGGNLILVQNTAVLSLQANFTWRRDWRATVDFTATATTVQDDLAGLYMPGTTNVTNSNAGGTLTVNEMLTGKIRVNCVNPPPIADDGVKFIPALGIVSNLTVSYSSTTNLIHLYKRGRMRVLMTISADSVDAGYAFVNQSGLVRGVRFRFSGLGLVAGTCGYVGPHSAQCAFGRDSRWVHRNFETVSVWVNETSVSNSKYAWNGIVADVAVGSFLVTYNPSRTRSMTLSPSATLTETITGTLTQSLSASVSSSATASASGSESGSGSVSLSATASVSLSPSPTQTASASVSQSLSPSASGSVSPSHSASASQSPSASASPSASGTASPSASASATASQTLSPSGTQSVSGSASLSPSPSGSASQTSSLTASLSPTSTASPSQSLSLSPTQTLSGVASPSLSVSQTPSQSQSSTVTGSSTLSLTPSLSPTYSLSQTPTMTQSETLTKSVSNSLSSTYSVSSSYSQSMSQSLSLSSSLSSSIILTLSKTIAPTTSPTVTDSSTKSKTVSFTLSASNTATITATSSGSGSNSPSHTPSNTYTSLASPTLSLRFTSSISASLTFSVPKTLSLQVTTSSSEAITLSRSGLRTATSSMDPSLTATVIVSFTRSARVSQSKSMMHSNSVSHQCSRTSARNITQSMQSTMSISDATIPTITSLVSGTQTGIASDSMSMDVSASESSSTSLTKSTSTSYSSSETPTKTSSASPGSPTLSPSDTTDLSQSRSSPLTNTESYPKSHSHTVAESGTASGLASSSSASLHPSKTTTSSISLAPGISMSDVVTSTSSLLPSDSASTSTSNSASFTGSTTKSVQPTMSDSSSSSSSPSHSMSQTASPLNATLSINITAFDSFETKFRQQGTIIRLVIANGSAPFYRWRTIARPPTIVNRRDGILGNETQVLSPVFTHQLLGSQLYSSCSVVDSYITLECVVGQPFFSIDADIDIAVSVNESHIVSPYYWAGRRYHVYIGSVTITNDEPASGLLLTVINMMSASLVLVTLAIGGPWIEFQCLLMVLSSSCAPDFDQDVARYAMYFVAPFAELLGSGEWGIVGNIGIVLAVSLTQYVINFIIYTCKATHFKRIHQYRSHMLNVFPSLFFSLGTLLYPGVSYWTFSLLFSTQTQEEVVRKGSVDVGLTGIAIVCGCVYMLAIPILLLWLRRRFLIKTHWMVWTKYVTLYWKPVDKPTVEIVSYQGRAADIIAGNGDENNKQEMSQNLDRNDFSSFLPADLDLRHVDTASSPPPTQSMRIGGEAQLSPAYADNDAPWYGTKQMGLASLMGAQKEPRVRQATWLDEEGGGPLSQNAFEGEFEMEKSRSQVKSFTYSSGIMCPTGGPVLDSLSNVHYAPAGANFAKSVNSLRHRRVRRGSINDLHSHSESRSQPICNVGNSKKRPGTIPTCLGSPGASHSNIVMNGASFADPTAEILKQQAQQIDQRVLAPNGRQRTGRSVSKVESDLFPEYLPEIGVGGQAADDGFPMGDSWGPSPRVSTFKNTDGGYRRKGLSMLGRSTALSDTHRKVAGPGDSMNLPAPGMSAVWQPPPGLLSNDLIYVPKKWDTCQESQTVDSRLAHWMLPKGFYAPLCRNAFEQRNLLPDRSLFVVAPHIWIISVGLTLGIQYGPASSSCWVTFVAVASLYLAWAIVVAVFRPYRTRFTNILSVVVLLLGCIVCLLVLADTYFPHSARIACLILTFAALLIRSVHLFGIWLWESKEPKIEDAPIIEKLSKSIAEFDT